MENATDKQLMGKSWAGLFTLAFFVFAGLFVSQAIAWLIASFFGINMGATSMQALMQEDGNQTALLCMQLAYSATLFIAAPLAFYRFAEPTGLKINQMGRMPQLPMLIVLSASIVCAFLPASGFLVEASSNISFPESMAALEEYLQAQEESLQKLSNYLTSFKGIPSLLLGLLVVAIVPAIGEEILFRGLIQRYLQNIFGNPHVGIIMAGLLFSAFHLQFYGLVPRWILGVMFGYLYYWSGKLSTAVIAHLVNNGVTLIAIYIFNQSDKSMDLEEVGRQLSWVHLLVSASITAGLLWIFKNKAKATL